MNWSGHYNVCISVCVSVVHRERGHRPLSPWPALHTAASALAGGLYSLTSLALQLYACLRDLQMPRGDNLCTDMVC